MQNRLALLGVLSLAAASAFGAGWGVHASLTAAPPVARTGIFIPNPGDSLFYIPMSVIMPSALGIEAARDITAYLNTADPAQCEAAIAVYDKAIPIENFGGEYQSLRWFCQYAVASDDPAGGAASRTAMLENADGRRFVDYFSPNNWQPLRDYLDIKYGGSPNQDLERFRFVDELIRFNSPGRPEWEDTEQILRLLDLQPGSAIVDIGAGAGFFSYRFSDIVGPTGHVYAVELNPSDIQYMSAIVKAEGRTNMEVVMGPETGATGLAPGSVDVVFLCSTYQTIYTSMREDQRQVFLKSLKAALRPGGRVVISDNEPTVRNAVPYRGISVSKLLVAGQLEANGLRLVKEQQFIPQRYLLVFELAETEPKHAAPAP